MKVLLVSHVFHPEPVKLPGELAETLAAFGHDVTVLTGFPNYPSGEIYPGYRMRVFQRETIGKVKVVRVPIYPDHSKSSIKRALNFLSFALSATLLGPFLVPGVDIVHVYPPLTAMLPAWWISRLRGVPLTCEVQDLWPDVLGATGMVNRSWLTKAIGRFVQWSYGVASEIRVISNGFRANLIGKGVPAEKIHVISNWVDPDFYKPEEPDAELAEKLGLSGKINFMFAGTMGLAQGLDTVIDAARLARDIPDAQFVFVGDGVCLPDLQERARDLPNVKFLGRYPAEAMSKLYALADVLLIHLRDDPVFRITIPHKTFAYLASAKPVLAALTGDAAEVINNSAGGLVCAPDQPEELAALVKRFHGMSAEERAQMGANGRRTVVEWYSRDRLVSQLIATLESTLTAPVKRGIATRTGSIGAADSSNS